MYHIKEDSEDNDFSCTDIELILFLSKMLNLTK